MKRKIKINNLPEINHQSLIFSDTECKECGKKLLTSEIVSEECNNCMAEKKYHEGIEE
jgi:hypothetical protein